MTKTDDCTSTAATANSTDDGSAVRFIDYRDESQLDDVMRLVALDLSEPYSIFTYRYFLHRFPDLCILAVDGESGEVCGCVVGKIDLEHPNEGGAVAPSDEEALGTSQAAAGGDDTATADPSATHDSGNDSAAHNQQKQQPPQKTGYIGMLAVSQSYRRRGIGRDLVRRVLLRMKGRGCTSATLETEVSNVTAQTLYQNCFGFVREELLVRYYLNWGDAYRLRLWF